MWKPGHRLAADRRGLRYPSDLTDAEYDGSRRLASAHEAVDQHVNDRTRNFLRTKCNDAAQTPAE